MAIQSFACFHIHFLSPISSAATYLMLCRRLLMKILTSLPYTLVYASNIFLFMFLDRVRDLSIDPYQTEYTVGETISCTANGNPVPETNWYDEEATIIQNGDETITLTEDMVGNNRNFTCISTHSIDGIPYTDAASVIFNLKSESPQYFLEHSSKKA